MRYDYKLQSAFVEGFLSRIFSSERAEFSLLVFLLVFFFSCSFQSLNVSSIPGSFLCVQWLVSDFFDVGIKAGPPSKEKRICL